MHWRGVALTEFDGKRWYNDRTNPRRSLRRRGWFRLNSEDHAEPRMTGMPIHYTVLLEPIASTALFFANEAESVRGTISR